MLDLRFDAARSDRLAGTISYDVTVTNLSPRALLLPVILQLAPQGRYEGQPQGTQGRAPDGSWLVDLSATLPPGGLLAPGASSSGRTLTVFNPGNRPVAFDASVSGLLAGNRAPVFSTGPQQEARAGTAYASTLRPATRTAMRCATSSPADRQA